MSETRDYSFTLTKPELKESILLSSRAFLPRWARILGAANCLITGVGYAAVISALTVFIALACGLTFASPSTFVAVPAVASIVAVTIWMLFQYSYISALVGRIGSSGVVANEIRWSIGPDGIDILTAISSWHTDWAGVSSAHLGKKVLTVVIGDASHGLLIRAIGTKADATALKEQISAKIAAATQRPSANA